jgi:uncharacterized surface protein with fasciclin (FAS1) repeats
MRLGFFTWLTIVPMAVSLVSFVSVQPSEAVTKKHKHHKHAAACPAKCSNVVSTAAKEPDLKEFSNALKTAGLACCLCAKGPYTVFAPSNAAFNGQAKANKLSDDKDKLAKVLKYHVVNGKLSAADLAGKRSVTTLEGESLMLNAKDGKQIVDGAMVIKEIDAGNSIIYEIDTVLSPERGK